ncbi:helix-turn-helix domain-containing protein [Paraflavitalea sp. CAU 1676]|uniref:helix-turn-helix domain-containing protein n=1 Tax=Paraflavitalea sp. CAU 1676 TaxID=3032598 RepID=UPI0023DA85BC|nr:helix-turn-helix domain-containing protein [Paraflavitalea sp. CAU 1676]MDF2188127.1 helix-turn-helix domain-containing protein [Paraflavitalea sp. CAU 1676]
MTFSGVLNTIIMLGAIQGFIAGGLLFWGARNRKANRFLAIMLWLFSLASLELRMYQESFLYTTTIGGFIDAFIPRMIIMPIGPLLYFYIRASVEPGFRWEKKYRKHFYSVVLDLMPHMVAIIYVCGIVIGFVKKAIPLGYYTDVYNIYVDIPRWLSLTLYVWWSAKYLAANKPSQASPSNTANSNSISFRWLQQFVRLFLVMQVIWFLYLIPYVIPAWSDKLLNAVSWYPVYIPLAILIYWVGIKALVVTYNVPLLQAKNTARTQPLPADTVAQSLEILKKAMEQEKLYLDPALSLSSLSQHMGIAPKNISAILNQHLQTNFNEFVNTYRVREFQRRVLLPDFQHFNITSIAFDCGFNSQATFQRTFKQMTGMSPTEYRKSANSQPQ